MMQDMAIGEEGIMQTDKRQGLCGAHGPPAAELQDQELQA